MKILNRKQFLSLPSGVLYAKFDPLVFGEIAIKEESSTNDWYYQDLIEVQANDSDERQNLLFEALEKGKSFQMDYECIGRDGSYDDDQLFAVFEKDDVEKLIKRLNETIPNYPNF